MELTEPILPWSPRRSWSGQYDIFQRQDSLENSRETHILKKYSRSIVTTIDLNNCVGHAREVHTPFKVSEMKKYNKLCTRQSPRATNNCVEISYSSIYLGYFRRENWSTSIVSLSPWDSLQFHLPRYIFPGTRRSCDYSRFTVWVPTIHLSWGKPLGMRRRQSHLARPPNWLASNYFLDRSAGRISKLSEKV